MSPAFFVPQNIPPGGRPRASGGKTDSVARNAPSQGGGRG